jgi:hypothetical protein
METKPYSPYSPTTQNLLESAAHDMLQCLEDLVGKAAFEGLPEYLQENIHDAIAKARGTRKYG